jgi:hypothetical protein
MLLVWIAAVLLRVRICSVRVFHMIVVDVLRPRTWSLIDVTDTGHEYLLVWWKFLYSGLYSEISRGSGNSANNEYSNTVFGQNHQPQVCFRRYDIVTLLRKIVGPARTSGRP